MTTSGGSRTSRPRCRVSRACRGIYPRIALLSFVLAGVTALTLWEIGGLLIDDAKVSALFTVAMLAIATSLWRDIYGTLSAVRLPFRGT